MIEWDLLIWSHLHIKSHSIIHLQVIYSPTYSHVEIPHIFRIQLPFKGGPRALLYHRWSPLYAAVSRPTSHCSAARCRCWGSSAASRRTSRRAAYAMRCRPTCRCPCRWIPCKTSNQWWVDIGWVWWVRVHERWGGWEFGIGSKNVEDFRKNRS